MRILSSFIIMLLGCNQSHQENVLNREMVVNITANSGALIERRYYSHQKQPSRVVFFDEEMPTDSVVFHYAPSGQLDSAESYVYISGKYEKRADQIESQYYKDLLFKVDNCLDFDNLMASYLLIKELNDICTITNSILPDTREVKSIEKISMPSVKERVITYDSLKAKFNHLSTDIESHFYNQSLNKLVIIIRSRYLAVENYYYSSGVLTRMYEYENGKVKRKTVNVEYNNGAEKSHEEWLYSYPY